MDAGRGGGGKGSARRSGVRERLLEGRENKQKKSHSGGGFSGGKKETQGWGNREGGMARSQNPLQGPTLMGRNIYGRSLLREPDKS